MTYKEILNKTRLVGDVLDNRVYLAIVKKDIGDGLIEISEQREFTKDEIIKTIFQLSKIYLESKNKKEYTFSNGKENITISIDKLKGEKDVKD